MANLRYSMQHRFCVNSFLSLLKEDRIIYQSVRSKHMYSFKSNAVMFRNLWKIEKKSVLTGLNITSVRLASTDITNLSETVTPKQVDTTLELPALPEPPSLPSSGVTSEEIIEGVVAASGEPSFASLGLGSWSPVGIVQQCMEFLHIGCDLPWWTSIFIGTVVVRIVLFPLVVMAQRNAAKMNNNLPQMQYLQLKMTEARQSGNKLEAARYGQEMMLFMKEKKLNPLANMLPPLAQAPVFISFFMALRGMCNTPVESLKTGGLYWFTDLTVPDQYFLLPIITSATLWVTIEVGTDTARLNSSNMGMMKYVFRALPIIIFPFTVNFPGAILCYWASANFISLGQVAFLRIPAVRDYFKIEPLATHPKENLPLSNKGFVKGFKESMTNMKITRELEAREHIDEIQFNKAGRAPVQRTFKYDPTKVPKASSIQAKKQ